MSPNAIEGDPSSVELFANQVIFCPLPGFARADDNQLEDPPDSHATDARPRECELLHTGRNLAAASAALAKASFRKAALKTLTVAIPSHKAEW